MHPLNLLKLRIFAVTPHVESLFWIFYSFFSKEEEKVLLKNSLEIKINFCILCSSEYGED